MIGNSLDLQPRWLLQRAAARCGRRPRPIFRSRSPPGRRPGRHSAAPPVMVMSKGEIPGSDGAAVAPLRFTAPPATHQRRLSPPPLPRPCRRQTCLLSVAGLAWGPGALLDTLKGEASLWQQEAQLYGRKAATALGSPDAGERAPLAADMAAAGPALQLDAGLAAALLAAPLQALSQQQQQGGSSRQQAAALPAEVLDLLPAFDEQRYQQDYAALLQQELPYFQKAGSCGHCGATNSPDALADRAWFDFQAYIQYKALGRQLGAALSSSPSVALSGWERMHADSPEMQLRAAAPGADAAPASIWAGGGGGSAEDLQRAAAEAYKARGQQVPGGGDGSSSVGAPSKSNLSAADALRLAVGGVILEHIVADLSAAGADAGARSGGAISSTSPELDAVRAGAQALLAYFSSKGECRWQFWSSGRWHAPAYMVPAVWLLQTYKTMLPPSLPMLAVCYLCLWRPPACPLPARPLQALQPLQAPPSLVSPWTNMRCFLFAPTVAVSACALRVCCCLPACRLCCLGHLCFLRCLEKRGASEDTCRRAAWLAGRQHKQQEPPGV